MVADCRQSCQPGSLSGYLSNSVRERLGSTGSQPSFMPPGGFGRSCTSCWAWRLRSSLRNLTSKTRRNALILFFSQLALNFAWSPIFFAAHAIQPALVVIVVMVGLAALAAGQFRRIRPWPAI